MTRIVPSTRTADDARAQAKELDEEIVALRTERDILSEEVMMLKANKDGLSKDLKRIQDNHERIINGLIKNTDALDGRLFQLSKREAKNAKVIEEQKKIYTKQRKDIEADRSIAKNAKDSAKKNISASKKVMADIEKEIAEMTAKRAELYHNVNDLDADCKMKNDELDAIEKRSMEILSEVKQARLAMNAERSDLRKREVALIEGAKKINLKFNKS